MTDRSVMLDACFLCNLVNIEEKLHPNAKEYFEYFLNEGIPMYVSVIAIAEYCVYGKLIDLPMRAFRIVSYNLAHAQRTGAFSKILFKKRRNSADPVPDRNIIPNDSKIFAQADMSAVTHFLTSDTKAITAVEHLKGTMSEAPNPLNMIPIYTGDSLQSTFGVLF